MEKFKIQKHMDAAKATMQRASLCTACEEPLKKDAPGIWIQGEGVFHPGCVEFPPEGAK